MSAKTSFLDYNLAPLSLRRDIAILGLLHKVNAQPSGPENTFGAGVDKMEPSEETIGGAP